MTKLTQFISLTFIFLLCTGISNADVLIIDRIQKSQSVNMPSRGTTMNQVVAEFGEPAIRKESIGEPPITVWKYNKFSVYFENSWVINSVINKATPKENGPKPIRN